MNLRIEFDFGIGRDKDGLMIPAIAFIPALARIKKKAVELYGGYTIYTTQGGWVNNGALIEEDGRTLLIYTTEGVDHKVHEMANFIKEVLDQEAVYVSYQPVTLEQI